MRDSLVNAVKGLSNNAAGSALKDYDYDPNSGAFINRKPSPAKQKLQIQGMEDKITSIESSLDDLSSVKSEVDEIKSSVNELKDLIVQLANKQA